MSLAKTARVLVVDDQAAMANMIAEDLCDRGYQGIASTSGHEALRLLQMELFDAVVADMSMPEIDGFAVLHASQMFDPSRPVIMMTGAATIETAVEATGRGAYHYLRKPFRLEVLFRLIKQAIRDA